MSSRTPPDLQHWFGGIDVYLFDQVLRGRLHPRMRILDAGCGSGRNLVWFLRSGFDVHAVDDSPESVARVRELATALAPHLAADRFRLEALPELSFDDGRFDAVICNAVLHFAPDEATFRAMVIELWRVLVPGGLLFCRLASREGIESGVRHLEGHRYLLPDGSTRYLVDDAILVALTAELGGRLADPIKTVNVQGLRCMATWCVVKEGQTSFQSSP